MTLGTIFKKHTITTSISDILSESMTSDGNIDVKVLNKLDPIIKEIGTIISEMKAIDVPSSFVALHLETLNGFELVMENLSDIKLVDSDPLLAISAVSQYGNNDATLKTSIEKLIAAFK